MPIHFNFADPFPTKTLEGIFPLGMRARSLIARASQNPLFPKDYSVRIGGAVHMLEGLDYHHQRFLHCADELAPYYKRIDNLLKQPCQVGEIQEFPELTPAEQELQDALHHEAFGYIGRLGQFWYFSKGLEKDGLIEADLIPRCTDLMLFRQKHVAHRSMDSPRKEDAGLEEIHALAMGFGLFFRDSFPKFQIQHHGKCIQLHMRNDHPIVMQEALAVLQSFVEGQSQQGD